MTTPHHVGQVTKAEITITDLLDTWGSPEPAARAAVLVAALADLGWTPPRDLTERPPARGGHSTDEGRAAARRLYADMRAAARDAP